MEVCGLNLKPEVIFEYIERENERDTDREREKEREGEKQRERKQTKIDRYRERE